MGFLSKIFKKKKGGTFLGNMIRGVASKASGGILGSGAQLRAWENKQEQAEKDAMMNGFNSQIQQLTQKLRNQNVSAPSPYDGRQAGENLMQKVIVPTMASGGNGQPTVQGQTVGESVFMETLKKKWYIPAGVLTAVIGAVYLLKGRNHPKKRGNLLGY